jgi:hypothetical protein
LRTVGYGNIIHIIFRAVFSLILLMPIFGVFGILPSPTREFYNTDIAFAFIELTTRTACINYIMIAVNVAVIIALWTRREALAALLFAPIAVNILGFHAFLDGACSPRTQLWQTFLLY